MTRFARANGSKASNKKRYEEATPWNELKKTAIRKKNKKSFNESIEKIEPEAATFNDGAIDNENLIEKGTSWVEMKTQIKKTKKQKNNTSIDDLAELEDLPDSLIDSTKVESKDETKTEAKKKSKGNENFVVEDGIKYRLTKDNKKVPWFDIHYEENEYMTKYNKLYVKREAKKVLDEYKQQLIDEGLEEKEIKNKLFKAEDKHHRTLRVEMLRQELSTAKDEGAKIKISAESKKKIKKTSGSDNFGYNDQQYEKEYRPPVDFKFEENDLMTEYEGYWILRESRAFLERIKKKKIQNIYFARRDGNQDEKLTEEEEVTLSRVMKKEKRRENKQLKLHLDELHKESYNHDESNNSNLKKRKAASFLEIDFNEDDNKMVKFDGFWIKTSAAKRLQSLKNKLYAEGCSEEEVAAIIKNERRKEERIMKQEKKLFCYQCRRNGHMLATCPESKSSSIEVCFKCGSTEHMARNCSRNKKDGYTHATCFICNEVGHISKECPDNPKGLYPNGGSCKLCDSVEHFMRECPTAQQSKADASIKLATYDPNGCIDDIDDEVTAKADHEDSKPKTKKAKIVRF